MNDRKAVGNEVAGMQPTHPGGGFFEIHVRGHLSNRWSEWLGSLQVRLLDDGEMVLAGYLVDQAALMGLLNRLYGLNLALLSVSKVEQEKPCQ